MSLIKFLKSFLSTQLSSLIGGHNYNDWEKEYYSLKKVSVKNTPLIKELQRVCKKNGFLLFSELLHIDQFSKHGYHNTHTSHAFQHQSHSYWAKALAIYCKKNNIKHIVDIGCGDGNLGVLLLKEAIKQNIRLTWSGVELYEPMHKIIYDTFKKNNLEKQIVEVTSSVEGCIPQKNTLLIFFYSLDSTPSECFLTTNEGSGIPNSIIGVKFQENCLQEFILTENELKQKNMTIQDGIFSYQDFQFDLTSWQLYPMQRAYLPVHAYALLAKAVNHYPNSVIAIIDEFYALQLPQTTEHFSPPNNLLTFNRVYSDTTKIYEEIGENLYYFPMSLSSTLSVLSSLGFQDTFYDLEKRMAKKILDESTTKTEISYCTAVFAKNLVREKQLNKLFLNPPY